MTIPVATAQNAVKLPNTALRYKPTMSAEEILALYKQYGIDEAGEKQAAADPVGAAANAPQTAAATPLLPGAPKAANAIVWKLRPDNTIEPVKVSLGITDHAYTEVVSVLKGHIKEGDDVIIRSVTPKSQGLAGLPH